MAGQAIDNGMVAAKVDPRIPRTMVADVSARPQVTSVSIVVPCYNESASLDPLKKHLSPLLEGLRGHRTVELVFVDDGSRDDTYDLLMKLFPSTPANPVKVVRHVRNQGLSSALRSAATVVTGDVVCTLDADSTYAPTEVLGLLELMDRSGADVVTGSPYHPKGGVENVQGWRLALSRSASRMYSLLVPEKLYCYTSMFRAYRREWFRPDYITSDRFVGVTEILVRSIFAGATVVEYPCVLHRRQYGDSKLKVGAAALEHFKLMGRVFVQAVAGRSRSN